MRRRHGRDTERSSTAELHEGAVTIVRGFGKPIVEVARELGIGAGTLGNWVKKDRLARGDESGTRVDPAYVRGLEREVAELGWSVMSSSDPWSGGSTRQHDDRGIVRRRPEGTQPASPMRFLSSC